MFTNSKFLVRALIASRRLNYPQKRCLHVDSANIVGTAVDTTTEQYQVIEILCLG